MYKVDAICSPMAFRYFLLYVHIDTETLMNDVR